MMWDGGWHMWWMWMLGPMGFLALVLIALAISRGSGDGGSTRRESPEDILRRRYAAGEIDHDEFERRLTDLRR